MHHPPAVGICNLFNETVRGMVYNNAVLRHREPPVISTLLRWRTSGSRYPKEWSIVFGFIVQGGNVLQQTD